MSGEDKTPEQVFEERVQEVVAKATETDTGLVLTDEAIKDLPVEIVASAKRELRYRNTQSKFTKISQEFAKTKTVADKLRERIESNVTLNLTNQETNELKTLKVNDPEKWRTKMSEYETRAKEQLTTELQQIEKEGDTLSQVEVRKAQLAAFNEQTGVVLTDELIDNELPPKYKADLAAGKIDFVTFLGQAHDFLTKAKVIKGAKDDPENEPNLSKAGGSHQPAEKAIEGSVVETYKNAVF